MSEPVRQPGPRPSAAEVLRRIRADRTAVPEGERCEMCGESIGEPHSHVVNVTSRAMLCTCRPCYLLFTSDGADLAYRAVPDRVLAFSSFAMSQGQWDDLAIPVSVAFFFHHSGFDRVVAFYPSPAGATESELPLDAWDGIVAANPGLRELRPDVEAILLRREGGDTRCFLVPVDACYELVGQLRQSWRGFDGGTEVHRRLADFFADVAARARPAPVATEAMS